MHTDRVLANHRSGVDRVGARIQEVVACYERLTRARVELTDIHTAMLAHWFCNYWNWRDRLETRAQSHEVISRLSLRIRLVLSSSNCDVVRPYEKETSFNPFVGLERCQDCFAPRRGPFLGEIAAKIGVGEGTVYRPAQEPIGNKSVSRYAQAAD
jgi:hypothetical protein